MLFPEGRPEHVPIIAVCGDEHQSGVIEFLRSALSEAGHTVGSATRAGLCVAGRHMSSDNPTGPVGARTLLQDPRIDAAILETPVGVVAAQGLGIEACDVVVITDAPMNNTGEIPGTTVQALETIAGLAQVAVAIDVDHPLREKLMQGRDADGLIAISMRPSSPELDAHISSGGAAVTFDGEADPPVFTAIQADHPRQRVLCHQFDRTDDDEGHHRATAFAIAAALAVEISVETISQLKKT